MAVPNASHARHMSADALDRIAAATAPETFEISRDALVDLLTTAACLGRDARGGTREEVAEYLAGYGLSARSPRLDASVASAENVAAFLRAEAAKAGA